MPAGGQDPAYPAQTAAVHRRRQLVRPGEAAHRVRQVAVRVGVAGERARARARGGRTSRGRSSPAARAWVRDLEDHDAAARAHDARHLGDAAAADRRSCARRSRPSRRRSSRWRTAARARRPTRSAAPGALRARAREHPLGEVAGDDLAVAPDRARERDREVAGAGRDVDRAAAGTDRRRARPRERASGGAGPPSSPCSSRRRARRCGRTSRAPGPLRACRRLPLGHYFRSDRKATAAVELLRRQRPCRERRHRLRSG